MKLLKNSFCAAILLIALATIAPPAIHGAADSADPIQALKIYPADIRAAIAEVLQHPDVLIELEKYRQVARAQFKEILAAYPQKTQDTVRQLVPYRKLWRGLGTYLGSEKETQDLLKAYPKNVQDLANYLLKNNPDVIGKVVDMEKKTYQQFFQIISGLNPQAQAAFKKAGQHSGILSVLSDALNLASAASPPSAELKQKSQALANQLLALNADGKPTGFTPGANASDAELALHASKDKMTDRLDSQIDQDPYSENSIQATVTFSPDPYYNAYMGGRHVNPYWY